MGRRKDPDNVPNFGMRNARRKRVYMLTGGKCFYCDRALRSDFEMQLLGEDQGWENGCVAIPKEWGEMMEIDHWHPRALGGRDSVANLRPACAPCNRAKGAMDPVKFLTRHSGKAIGWEGVYQ